MKLLLLHLCLVTMATHVRLQEVSPTTSQTSSYAAELTNLRNFLNEILSAMNSPNGVAYDQGSVLSFLSQSLQNMIKVYEASQQGSVNVAVTPPADRTNITLGLTSGSFTANGNSTAFSNTNITLPPLPVYDSSVTRPQEPPGREKLCELPSETGLCRGYFVKFHFDPKAGRCATFVYGGCGGNGNRFDTEEECKKRCVV